MPITKEMQKYLEKLQYDKDGKFDRILYFICKSIYYRERLSGEEIFHITRLDEVRKNDLFNFINVCNPDICKDFLKD